MTRKWTKADDVAARELGFRFIILPSGRCGVLWVGSLTATMTVDLYVWFLAQEGEPTAVKVLDIMEARDPDEFISMVQYVMKVTCNAT